MKEYHLVNYIIQKGFDTSFLHIVEQGMLMEYQKMECKFLTSAHPLVHSFPVHDLKFKQEEKSKCILRHAVMEVIFCTFIDCPFDIVCVLVSMMLGEEFKLEDFYNLQLPTPLNLAIDDAAKAYKHKFCDYTTNFLALLECNQLQKGM